MARGDGDAAKSGRSQDVGGCGCEQAMSWAGAWVVSRPKTYQAVRPAGRCLRARGDGSLRPRGQRSAGGRTLISVGKKCAHLERRGSRFSGCVRRTPRRIGNASRTRRDNPPRRIAPATDRASDDQTERRRGNAGRNGTLEFGSLGDGTPPRTHSNRHRTRRIASTAVTCRAASAVRTEPSSRTMARTRRRTTRYAWSRLRDGALAYRGGRIPGSAIAWYARSAARVADSRSASALAQPESPVARLPNTGRNAHPSFARL